MTGFFRLVRAGAFALVFSVSGCTTLGPDFTAPDTAWLEAWESKLASTSTGSVDDLSQWWQVFNDPVLDQFIASVKRDSLPLDVAALRVLEARARLQIAESTLYPQVNQVSGSADYINASTGDAIPLIKDDSLVRYQVGLGVGWEPDFWGKFARLNESASSAYRATENDYYAAEVSVVSTMVDLYFAYKTTLQRLEITRSNGELQARSFDITRQLFEAGERAELDVQQAKAQYYATLSAIPAVEQALVEIGNAIAVLQGKLPNSVAELSAITPGLPAVGSIAVDVVPVDALLRRPDVNAALWSAAAQSAQLGIAEADFYPSIAFAGGASWSGINSSGLGDSLTLLAGPRLNWTIFDWGNLEGNLLVQDARLRQAVTGYRAVLISAAKEVDDAASAISNTAKQNDILHESVTASTRALSLAQTRYREGYADFQRVLDAQRALFNQQDRELSAQSAYFSAVSRLYRALGGGWSALSAATLRERGYESPESYPERWDDVLKSESN